MTREDAKAILKNCLDKAEYKHGAYGIALEMAIKALEQEPCNDAISREDAEQMFRNIRSHLKPQDYKSAEEFNTRDLMLLNAEQMIHALPSVTQKLAEWIPVSERLPEINDDVLISLEWGIDIGRYSDGEWCSEWINNYDDGNVYAWMPLPALYEPQESEDKE